MTNEDEFNLYQQIVKVVRENKRVILLSENSI